MAFIPTPNCAQIELMYSWSGQTCETVLHYQFSADANVTRLTALADACITLWTTNVKPLMASTLSLVSVIATDLENQNGPSITRAGGLPSAGTQTGDCLPNNCALVITKRTANRGRSFRGRIYSPAIPEPQTANNTPTTTFVNQLVTAWSTFISVTITGPEVVPLGVISKFANNTPRAEGIFTPVTNLTSDGVLDSQRRRLPGRGK